MIVAQRGAGSRGPIEKLERYRKRMNRTFRWVSSAASDFNFDYHVSFPAGDRYNGVFYNFERQPDPEVDELPGVSALYKDDDGSIGRHTESSAARPRVIVEFPSNTASSRPWPAASTDGVGDYFVAAQN